MSKPQNDIWFPWYVSDYLADTMHLTMEQHGVYVHLLMAYYRNKGPLPDQPEYLASVCKTTPEQWAKYEPVMRKFFDVEDGHWKQARCDTEIARIQIMRKKASAKAKKAAQKRWENREQN